MSGFKEEGGRFTQTERARGKLFMHGGSQAVRLPKAFRFDGTEVEIHRDGDCVVLQPVRARLPRTEDERAAFWSRIDALRGDHVLAYPTRDECFFGPDPVLNGGDDDQP